MLPVTGAIADRTARKKRLLALLRLHRRRAPPSGCCFLTGDRYLLGGALFLLANVAFGASIVVYNSFLPQLAGPDDRDTVSSIGWAHRLRRRRPAAAAQPGRVSRSAAATPTDLIARVVASSRPACGGRSSPRCRCAGCETRSRRVAGAAAGQPCSPTGSGSSAQTLRGMRAYPLTLFFLIAFLVYNDGIQTVIARGQPVRRRVAAGSRTRHADHHDPDRAVPRVRRRAAAGRAGPHVRRVEDRAGQPRAVDRSWSSRRYFLPAGEAVPFMLLGVRARHRARRQPGAEPLAVQPADPERQGGRVLRLLRDQRQGHELARPAGRSGCRTRSPAATGSRSCRCWSSS